MRTSIPVLGIEVLFLSCAGACDSSAFRYHIDAGRIQNDTDRSAAPLACLFYPSAHRRFSTDQKNFFRICHHIIRKRHCAHGRIASVYLSASSSNLHAKRMGLCPRIAQLFGVSIPRTAFFLSVSCVQIHSYKLLCFLLLYCYLQIKSIRYHFRQKVLL